MEKVWFADEPPCPNCRSQFDIPDATKKGIVVCPNCQAELYTVEKHRWIYTLSSYICGYVIAYLCGLESLYLFFGTLIFGIALTLLFRGFLPAIFHLPQRLEVRKTEPQRLSLLSTEKHQEKDK